MHCGAVQSQTGIIRHTHIAALGAYLNALPYCISCKNQLACKFYSKLFDFFFWRRHTLFVFAFESHCCIVEWNKISSQKCISGFGTWNCRWRIYMLSLASLQVNKWNWITKWQKGLIPWYANTHNSLTNSQFKMMDSEYSLQSFLRITDSEYWWENKNSCWVYFRCSQNFCIWNSPFLHSVTITACKWGDKNVSIRL